MAISLDFRLRQMFQAELTSLELLHLLSLGLSGSLQPFPGSSFCSIVSMRLRTQLCESHV